MERRHASGDGPRGGDGIQAPRPPRPRLIPAGAAVLLAVGLAAYPAAVADRAGWLVTALGAASLAVLAAALAARRAGPVAWALALLGAEYAAWLSLDGGPVDTRSPLYAAGFLLVAELAYDGLERGLVRAPIDLVARRCAVLVSLVVASIALGALVLAVSAIPLGQSVVLTAVGVAAAAVALALLSRLARARE